jgi:hypothetical protein
MDKCVSGPCAKSVSGRWPDESPAALVEAYHYQLLPPDQAELVEAYLPAGDAARAGGLRNEQLSKALREVAESLDETPTPAALRRRRDQAWTPAVGEPCEGRYKAGEDGLSRRKDYSCC